MTVTNLTNALMAIGAISVIFSLVVVVLMSKDKDRKGR